MTNAYASMHGRSLASTLDVGAAGATLLARLRDAWDKRQAYWNALAELRDLPARSLRDLDLERDDIEAIAHRAVYGR